MAPARIVASLALAGGLAAGASARGQESPAPPSFADAVTVTATRHEVPWGSSGRFVEVLTGEEIEAYGVRSVPELLQLFPGVDVRRRGVYGVQADLSVRGGSFEQVLVLVDGVPVNDPQTGHHTLDLPVPVAAIDRVEVLYGPGSALYGANAAGGVVQIFTKAKAGAGAGAAAKEGGPARSPHAGVEAFAGQHSLAGAVAQASAEVGRGSHRVTLERTESDGYREGLEFDQGSGFYRGSFRLPGAGASRLDLAAGASDRDFGAQNFYSTRFPSQLEFTAARFASAAWQGEAAGTVLHLQAAGRWHDDRFVLDRHDPGLLTNVHEDRSVDLQARASRETVLGTLDVGAGWLSEDLDSTNLGVRARERWGSFAALAGERGRWQWRTALHGDRVDGDWEVHPAAALSAAAGPGRLRGSVASAYRVPSFTELYYLDPVSAGNPDLQPEHAWTYEAGYDWVGPRSRAAATAFERRGRDLIDFVLAPGDDHFRAVNLRQVTTRGVELVAARRLGAATVTASYAWLDSYGSEPAGDSAYVFDYLEHRALLRAHGTGPWALSWGASLGYSDRYQADDWVRLDARVARRLPRRWPGGAEVFVEGTNLTDERYVEQGAVEMPGRWLVAGFRLGRF